MDLSELKGIISMMQKSDLSELEIEVKDLKLRLARPEMATPESISPRGRNRIRRPFQLRRTNLHTKY